MKKAKRLLSILLALMMLLGTVSVFASAASHPYKDDAIGYNDVDKPTFSTEQYASMAIDEVDRMLAEENLVLNVYVLTLDLTSVDSALHSLGTALTSVSALLPLLEDAQLLDDGAFWVNNNTTVARNNTTDINILYTLLKFLSDNTTTVNDENQTVDGVIALYAKGIIDLGVLNSLVSDYVFNLRELAICMLYSLMDGDSDYDYFDDGTTGVPTQYLDAGGFDVLLQDLLNYFVLGEWIKMDDKFDLPRTDGEHRDFEDYFDGTRDAGKDYYGWYHREGWVTYALGGTEIVNAGAAAPAPNFGAININSAVTGYEFIENLIQVAYNKLAVPVLNRETRPWLRELCGVTYLREKMDPNNIDPETGLHTYVEDYDGEPYAEGDLDTTLSELFDVDNMYVPEANLSGTITTHGALNNDGDIVYSTTPATLNYNYTTFIAAFNTTLGQFIDAIILKPEAANTWTWYYGTGSDGDNAYLFKNICNVARYVLGVTGDKFFAAYIKTNTAAQYNSMNDQQVVSFVLRAVLNASVDWMYIPEDVQTVAEVGFAACQQLAAQDIPQFDYPKPAKGSLTDEAYNRQLVDGCLDILLDVAVYNLNQSLDMVPASGADPKAGEGLLQYVHDYEPLVLQVVAWALSTYGAAVEIEFNCDNANGATTGLTINDAWSDIDTLINSIIPIKGTGAWLNGDIAGQQYVIKSLLFDNVVAPITSLDSTDLEAIFMKNASGEFATKSVKPIAIGLVERILEILFPNLVESSISTFDAVLESNTIASIVVNLVNGLYNRREDLLKVALPIVCDVIGLSAEQEFKEMEVYMPGLINKTDAQTNGFKFKVYNGSQGLNTAYTDEYGAQTQDHLYKYVISSAAVLPAGCGISATGLAGAIINGGDSVDATLSGNFNDNANSVIELAITYNVYGEDGTTPLTSAPLTSSSYAYISNATAGDDEIEIKETLANGYEITYSSDMYIDAGGKLADIEGRSFGFKADDDGAAITLQSASLASKPNNVLPAGSVAAPNGLIVASSEKNSVAETEAGGRYFLFPYSVATYTDTSVTPNAVKKYDLYKTWEETTKDPQTNEDIVTVKNNGGIAHGKYVANATFVASGESKTVSTGIHLYNDYGLVSAYNSAVAANRQSSAYDPDKDSGAAAGLFNAYKAALRNAGKLVLAPKEGTTFEADTAATDGTSANLYEQYAEALEEAITALKDYELSAPITDIQAAIARFSPVNYTVSTVGNVSTKTDLEYDDPNYTYFGMRDFVPHTYSNYKSVRNHAQDLVNTQLLFAPIAPDPADYGTSQYEYSKYLEARDEYDKAMIQYNEAVANITPLGAVEAVYATHMVDLMGSRLIALDANVSKLQEAYNLYNRVNGTAVLSVANPATYYTAESWNAYVRASDFAQATLAINVASLRPSRVNTALSELVECWKKLVKCADYSELNTQINAANAILDDSGSASAYTEISLNALRTACEAGEQLVLDNLANTKDNNDRILAAANAIVAALGALDPIIISSDPVWEVTTDPEFFEDDYGVVTPFVDADINTYAQQDMGMWSETQGALYGLGTYFEEQQVEDAFVSMENATVNIIPTSAGAGTGTKAQIVDGNGEVTYEYFVVVIGDLNGDAMVDNSDILPFKMMLGGKPGYGNYYDMETEKELAINLAADLTGDWAGDGTDYGIFKQVTAGKKVISQMDRAAV